jgi:hypothetical protein
MSASQFADDATVRAAANIETAIKHLQPVSLQEASAFVQRMIDNTCAHFGLKREAIEIGYCRFTAGVGGVGVGMFGTTATVGGQTILLQAVSTECVDYVPLLRSTVQ